eukprot:1195218-Prorocentrum_minimum.AAC.4
MTPSVTNRRIPNMQMTRTRCMHASLLCKSQWRSAVLRAPEGSRGVQRGAEGSMRGAGPGGSGERVSGERVSDERGLMRRV